MSLTAVLNNAVSGLNVAQGSLSVTASNIANVNTEGYARKIVKQGTVVLGGVGLGVELTEVRRVIDQFISRELRVLRTMRLVKYRRVGKRVYYTLDDDHVRQIFAAGLEHVREP